MGSVINNIPGSICRNLHISDDKIFEVKYGRLGFYAGAFSFASEMRILPSGGVFI